jgi:hypothetical protein
MEKTYANFEEFWKVYPKKKEKSLALIEWNKLKPNEELKNEIIRSVENYKKTDQWQEAGGKYIIYPARFLKRKRWEDEVEDCKQQVIKL